MELKDPKFYEYAHCTCSICMEWKAKTEQENIRNPMRNIFPNRWPDKDVELLPLLTKSGNPILKFPMRVYNVKQEEIGTVATVRELIDLWNSDPHNREWGTLERNNGRKPGIIHLALVVNQERDKQKTAGYLKCVIGKST